MPRGVPKNSRPCAGEDCGRNLRAGWPHDKCATCRALEDEGEGASSEKRSRKRAAEETPAPFDAIGLISSLGLDYCVGSAARFLLEVRDGDELENLRTARTYVDHAIAAREATA